MFKYILCCIIKQDKICNNVGDALKYETMYKVKEVAHQTIWNLVSAMNAGRIVNYYVFIGVRLIAFSA